MTVYGLSHLGDYEATLFSPHSNNRRFGQDFIEGKPFKKLAEGVSTTAAQMNADRLDFVGLPITAAVHAIIKEKQDPHEVLKNLFLRSTKSE